jgi:hypothetical protein
MTDFLDILNSFVCVYVDLQTPNLPLSASQDRLGLVFEAVVGLWAGGIL